MKFWLIFCAILGAALFTAMIYPGDHVGNDLFFETTNNWTLSIKGGTYTIEILSDNGFTLRGSNGEEITDTPAEKQFGCGSEHCYSFGPKTFEGESSWKVVDGRFTVHFSSPEEITVTEKGNAGYVTLAAVLVVVLTFVLFMAGIYIANTSKKMSE